MRIFFPPFTRIFAVCAVALSAEAATAKTCDVAIEGNDAMQYNVKELSVAKDCTEVKVTLKHAGKLPKLAMGHNWVLAAEADMPAVTSGGMQGGPTNDYLPKDMSKVIASTKLVGGGESVSTTFKTDALKAGTTYKYFCTFPGHFGAMQGTFSVK